MCTGTNKNNHDSNKLRNKYSVQINEKNLSYNHSLEYVLAFINYVYEE